MSVVVNLLNFHFANNYGAVLECLALQKVLKKMGYDVRVIDYHPYYLEQFYTPYPNPFKGWYWRYKMNWDESVQKRLYLSFRWMFSSFLSYRFFFYKKKLRNVFTEFYSRNLNLTRRYNSLKELRDLYPKGEVYICGSDQIWNPKVTSGFDPAYYLAFGNDKIKRIAYAVSPNKALDTIFFKKELSINLPNFANISLREKELLEKLSFFTDKRIDICLDPTLLLSQKDYEEFELPIDIAEPYILTYGFIETDGNDVLQRTLNQVQQILKYKVIDLSLENISWTCNVEKKKFVSPGQFLSYLKHSSYIVTNSFHGTAFSIIYRKDFLCVCKTGTENRMKELMFNLGLKNNLILNTSKKIIFPAPIDYVNVDNNLINLKENSIEWLKMAIEGLD